MLGVLTFLARFRTSHIDNTMLIKALMHPARSLTVNFGEIKPRDPWMHSATHDTCSCTAISVDMSFHQDQNRCTLHWGVSKNCVLRRALDILVLPGYFLTRLLPYNIKALDRDDREFVPKERTDTFSLLGSAWIT